MDDRVEKERMEFTSLLLQNPNYFGTYPDFDYNAVSPMEGNTKYEELRCLGFYPEEDQIEAILDVKLSYGYSGNLCSSGSFEYVRFYVDWDGDGNFTDPEEDVGMVSFNVHDIPDEEGVCREKAKPLSYALKLKVEPKKRICERPYLVKVRAILEWNRQPPPGTPDHPPIWGNVLERWIQIEPREPILADFIDVIDFSKTKIMPSMIDKFAPVLKRISLTVEELEKQYRHTDVPEYRYNAEQLAPIVAQIKRRPELLVEYQKDPGFTTKLESIKALLYGKPEVKYEELTCLGLHYDQTILGATIHVKLPYGYLGDKCHKGSYEHVAFWVRVYDSIEQQCVWRYLGTSSVNVHDIEQIPEEGLHYAVYLPCDLAYWKKSCSNAVVLQVRGVLSWNEMPSDTNPYWEPRWGNVKDVLIQLKPKDEGIPGDKKPYIWSVGDMSVTRISGNHYTLVSSALGDGYANGNSVGGGFEACESPFGGVAEITGEISNAPNDPADPDKLRYKVQYWKVGSATGWQDITNPFEITLIRDSEPDEDVWQENVGGYYTYQRDPAPSPKVDVLGDVLAQWDTRYAEGDGLYWLRLLLEDPAAPPDIWAPPGHVSSRIIRVMVDNTLPTAEITLDAGPCTKFEVGDEFDGTFTAIDDHIHKFSITVEPNTAVKPTIAIAAPASTTYPLLPAPGRINHVYTVTTAVETTPCGYVIRLSVWDRAIVNNHFPSHQVSVPIGLCLLEKEIGEGSE